MQTIGKMFRDSDSPSWCIFEAKNEDGMIQFQSSLTGFDIDLDISRENELTCRLPLLVVDQLVEEGWGIVGCVVSEDLKKSVNDRRSQRRQLFTDENQLNNEEINEQLKSFENLRLTPSLFQRRNLEKMLQYDSAASFSVPGAGKTGEAIAYWNAKKSENERLLVVLPKVATIAWKDELKKWLQMTGNEICSLDYSSSNFEQDLFRSSTATVFLITYHKLQTQEKSLSKFIRRNIDDGWSMILDESHNVKNYKGRRAEAVRRIGSMINGRRLILTGTPAPQGMKDLHSQAEFLYGIRIDEEKAVKLIEKIHVRTSKEDLQLLPTETTIHLHAHYPEHQEAYSEFIEGKLLEIKEISDLEEKRVCLRPHMTHMIMAATDPSIIPGYDFSNTDQSWKFDKVYELVQEMVNKNEKVIVWASFMQVIFKLRKVLQDFRPLLIHGSVRSASSLEDENDPETREWRFNQFKSQMDRQVIIANPAACGESISLHHWCNNAIYVDRTYNAAHFLQSKDRIHRFGKHPDTGAYTSREKVVNYHILQTIDTIDERIEGRLNEKIERQNNLLRDRKFSEALQEEGTDNEGVSNLDIDDLINSMLNLE